MRKTIVSIMTVAALVSGFVPAKAFADQVSDAITDHMKMAEKYDARAAEQKGLVEEHEQMKKDYKKTHYINDKFTPATHFTKMNQHCDELIKAAKTLEAKYAAVAEFHRSSAEEMKAKQAK